MSNKRKREQAREQLKQMGFTPDSAAAAVMADDLSLLKHSGRLRVPLEPPKPEPVPADEALDPDDDPNTAVTIAYVYQHGVEYSWHESMSRLKDWDLVNHGRVYRGGYVAMRGSTDGLAHARNTAVRDFLSDNRAAWLWWVDTDMGFDPDVIDRLMEAADPVERPIVGALCFAQRESELDGMGGWRPVAWPTIMDWNVYDARGGFEVRWDYPRNTVTRCHGTGSACILIHRSVFERMQAEYGEQIRRLNVERGIAEETGLPWTSWYSRVTNPTTGELVSEDLSFCMRLMRLSIPVHVHTGVRTTHAKKIWLQEADYWGQRALSPAPETVELIPREKWVAPRFAVVPTHNRPERLKALMASAGQQCDTIVVLDNASEPPVDWAELAAVATKATVEVLREPQQPPNLSRFWNILFDRCAKLATDRGEERWDVAVFNDDAVLPAGWFDACQTVLRGHDTAAAAHTGSVPVHRHELLDKYPYPREKRMCPWAFVVKGEAGLRADETFAWFYGDDDFTRLLIDNGGVMAVPGPIVINAHAVQATQQSPVLAELAAKDKVAFEAKWAGQL